MKCYQRCRHTVHSKITCLGYSWMSFLWRLKCVISDNPCIIMSCKVWYIWKRCIDLWIKKKKSSASGEYQVINFLNTKATGASLASIIFHICTCLARQKYNDLLKSDLQQGSEYVWVSVQSFLERNYIWRSFDLMWKLMFLILYCKRGTEFWN